MPDWQNPTDEIQERIDALVAEHLPGWTKVLRSPNFQRAWCEPGCPFPLNNNAALHALPDELLVPEGLDPGLDRLDLHEVGIVGDRQPHVLQRLPGRCHHRHPHDAADHAGQGTFHARDDDNGPCVRELVLH